jgi:predicted nuclease with TOPRIM domain
MKQRFLTDSQDALASQRRRSSDMNSNIEGHDYQAVLPDPSILGGSPRRLSTTGVTSTDVLPPIRSQSPSHPSSDGYGTRLPSMKPPPTPGRQLPSPPGRSHPSPPSYNMPSPSSAYPQSVASTSAQPPHPSLPNILHPLSPTPSSSLGTSTAIQAHTAALQHEVSVKKYALQTLQGEHDKLLAALRRSQTRARTLEEKQVASDLEINTLAEERVRLLTQVQELEQSIADVSKSRDEFRQAAVKGGAQYVKIVRMASQLEMMAGEERREWKRKLEENKATIDALRERPAAPRGPGGTVREFEALSSEEASPEDELKNEVQRLRVRCAEMETALKNIRSESHRFGEAITALSTAGMRISESVSGVLDDPPAAIETRALPPPPLPAEAPSLQPTRSGGEM